MNKSLLLALALLAFVCSVAAHAGHNQRGGMPYGWRNKREVAPSTCSYFQCSVGTCDIAAGRYCPASQYCNSGTCSDKAALGAQCTVGVEDVCAQGTCVGTGGAGSTGTCRYFRQTMPGNPCTVDDECSFFASADGTGANTGMCVAGVCDGRRNGDVCTASHQCVVGTFCDQVNGVCKALGVQSQACSADSECDSRLSCIASTCQKRYTVAEGQACSSTPQCQSGLYCSSSKVCTRANAATSSSKIPCDVSSTVCPANEECSCNGYQTAGQTATCNAIKGSFDTMASIEDSAFACMDQHGCNADTANKTNVDCIKTHCVSQYCTYFTRYVNDMFADYPDCIRARMVDSEFFGLSTTCKAYAPGAPTPASSSSSVLSASIAWVSLVSLAVFFFAF